MLYWGEGSKRAKYCVDLANSDPNIVILFTIFLRKIYRVDENKFRVLLYCYPPHDPGELIDYWSTLTHIPKSSFTKPYIRKKSRLIHDKMPKGLVHIRYYDKRLLQLILREIKLLFEKLNLS